MTLSGWRNMCGSSRQGPPGTGPIDLDDLLALWVPVPVRKVGAEQQQGARSVHRVRGGRMADQTGLADFVGVVAIEVGLRPSLQCP